MLLSTINGILGFLYKFDTRHSPSNFAILVGMMSMNWMYDDNICSYCGIHVAENNVVLVTTQVLFAFNYLQNRIMVLFFYATFILAYHLP